METFKRLVLSILFALALGVAPAVLMANTATDLRVGKQDEQIAHRGWYGGGWRGGYGWGGRGWYGGFYARPYYSGYYYSSYPSYYGYYPYSYYGYYPYRSYYPGGLYFYYR